MTATLKAPAESQAVATVQRPEIAAWVASKEAIRAMADQYLPLTIAGIDDKAGFEAVHKARMTVKNTRIAVEKRRKELKADALEYGRQVDSAAKQLTALLEPIELHLESQERAVEAEKARIRQEAEAAKQARVAKRIELLTALGAALDFAMINGATDEQFAVELEKAKSAHAERVLAEQAAAAERERQEVVRREQEAKLAAERAAMEAKLAAERAELERQRQAQAAEQARIDDERRRVAEEEAARQRAIELERAKAEAAEQARLEAERRAAERAEREKAEAEAREAARLKAEAERPHRDRLFALAMKLEALVAFVPQGPGAEQVDLIITEAGAAIRRVAGGPLESPVVSEFPVEASSEKWENA